MMKRLLLVLVQPFDGYKFVVHMSDGREKQKHFLATKFKMTEEALLLLCVLLIVHIINIHHEGEQTCTTK